MKITILGFYGKSNTGDESYKLVFPAMLPNHKLTFTDKLTGKLDCDALVVGGGDILYNNFPKQLASYPNIPKYAFSVSVRRNLPNIDFKRVISRDNVPGCDWLPDFTFLLTPDVNNGKRLIRNAFYAGLDLYEKVCIIVMNSNLMTQESSLARDSATFEKVAFDLAYLADNTNASFLFLPFGNGFPCNDRITNSIVYSRCKFWKKNAVVYQNYTPQETLDIISAADLVISSRLHSSIFSCIGGTPFIDITHHSKNKFFMQTIGKSEWSIDYWQFCAHQAKTLIKELLNNSSYRQELLTLSHVYRGLLQKAVPLL